MAIPPCTSSHYSTLLITNGVQSGRSDEGKAAATGSAPEAAEADNSMQQRQG